MTLERQKVQTHNIGFVFLTAVDTDEFMLNVLRIGDTYMHCRGTTKATPKLLDNLAAQYSVARSYAGLPLVVPQFESMRKAAESLPKTAPRRRSAPKADTQRKKEITKSEAVIQTKELLLAGTFFFIAEVF